jgi:hypothetical protein
MGLAVAVAGQPLERSATGVAEAEQTRALVERLARGVVEPSSTRNGGASGSGSRYSDAT